MAASSTCLLLLRAVNHPTPDEVTPTKEKSFRTCVAWLEDSKIRGLPIGERGPLRATGDASWDGVLAQYLAELACPILPDDSNRAQVLEWLLSHAVRLEYQDQATRFNEAGAEAAKAEQAKLPQPPEPVAVPARRPAVRLQDTTPPFDDVHLPAFVEALRALARSLNIAETADQSTSSLVKAVATAVRRHLSPAALKQLQQAATGSKRDGAGNPAPPSADLSQFPLGFDLGDPALERAAIVLRLMYIIDMKDLQSDVDKLLVDTQEFTADPRTDSKLGKVGR